MENMETPVRTKTFTETRFSTKRARLKRSTNSSPTKKCPPVSKRRHHNSAQPRTEAAFREINTSLDNSRTYLRQFYDIERKLGTGSYGEVFRVRRKIDGRMYAIKKVIEPFKDIGDRDNKLVEVKILKSLPVHSNLVGFVRAWEDLGYLYIETELCDYSLSDYTETGHQIPEETVWSIFIDLLHALECLHSCNFVHFDIKPQNVFVCNGNLCKLGDFGSVFNLNSVEETQSKFHYDDGDGKYMAPEILNWARKPAKSADIFSFGVTIVELACDLDMKTTAGSNAWTMLSEGILPTELMSELSDDLCRLLRIMLKRDPELRPTVEQLLNDPAVISHMNSRSERPCTAPLFQPIEGLLPDQSAQLDTFDIIPPSNVIANDPNQSPSATPVRSRSRSACALRFRLLSKDSGSDEEKNKDGDNVKKMLIFE